VVIAVTCCAVILIVAIIGITLISDKLARNKRINKK
jgi:hypothetical protein